MIREKAINYFDNVAAKRDFWKRKNSYYWKDLYDFSRFLIPEDASILDIGSGTGDFLARLKNSDKIGIDFSSEMIGISKKKYPNIDYRLMEAENLSFDRTFDYIILNNIIGYLEDIEATFTEIRKISHPHTKVIVTYYNFLWQPILNTGETLGMRMKQPTQNWLSENDITNLLYLSGFDTFKSGKRLLFPKYIPLISTVLNKYIAHLPFFKGLCINNYIIAKPLSEVTKEVYEKKYSVSVIIPARNESGNIENAILRTPAMGKHTEIIFIEGNSTDDTWGKIQEMHEKYKGTIDIKIDRQGGKGKGDAVRKGFEIATGDILMILDADLTVPPEDLPKFYNAIASERGEFVNGSRLVYNMDKKAMRFLNLLGNKFFSLMFTWLLDQRFKDTLCGTKVIFRKDYEMLKRGRTFFGDFDPFGDFDLIFGASKLNLKIIELPIRYKERSYGETNISRFRHGVILLKMCLFAAKKIKFI